MNDLVDQLLIIHNKFNSNELEHGLKYFQSKSLQKGEFLLKPGNRETGLFFISEGLFESYNFNSRGHIEVYWFEGKNAFITDVDGFILNKPSMTYIQACEDSVIFGIPKKSLDELCTRFNSWSIWRIKYLEFEYHKLYDFFRAFVHSTAEEKYDWLLHMYPDILKKVPLGHVASLMGISQVSLSRIRAAKQPK